MNIILSEYRHGLTVERYVLNLVHDEVSYCYLQKAQTGGREVRNPCNRKRADLFPAKAGVVFVAFAAIGNLGYRNTKHKGNQENYGRKKNHDSAVIRPIAKLNCRYKVTTPCGT